MVVDFHIMFIVEFDFQEIFEHLLGEIPNCNEVRWFADATVGPFLIDLQSHNTVAGPYLSDSRMELLHNKSHDSPKVIAIILLAGQMFKSCTSMDVNFILCLVVSHVWHMLFFIYSMTSNYRSLRFNGSILQSLQGDPLARFNGFSLRSGEIR